MPLSFARTEATWNTLVRHIFVGCGQLHHILFVSAEQQEERYISFEWLDENQAAELTVERMDAPVQKRKVGEIYTFTTLRNDDNNS
jgi:hypothetical protein